MTTSYTQHRRTHSKAARVLFPPTPLRETHMLRPPVNDNPQTNGEITYYRKILPELKVVVIAGAVHDETYVQMARPNVMFHMFEPNPVLCQLLRQKVGNRPNVFINQCGLAHEKGTSDYYPDTQSCLKRVHDIQSKDAPVKIPLRTLDDYCEEKKIGAIDFLKLDVEGLEVSILMGAKKMMNRIKTIQLEYGGCYKDGHWRLKQIYDTFVPSKKMYELFPDASLIERPNVIEDFRYTTYVLK